MENPSPCPFSAASPLQGGKLNATIASAISAQARRENAETVFLLLIQQLLLSEGFCTGQTCRRAPLLPHLSSLSSICLRSYKGISQIFPAMIRIRGLPPLSWPLFPYPFSAPFSAPVSFSAIGFSKELHWGVGGA